MASASSSVNISQPQIPVFKGESYEFWSIKMSTLFKSQDLWDYVENGYSEEGLDDGRLKENQKKDAKALFFIQQAVDETIFSRIAAATTSRQAWTILQTEYKGSAKVMTVKLQSLRREFETVSMKNNESVQEFLAKVSSIVSQMKTYGDRIEDETVVAKILRSLAPKFDHVVAAIEESKDLSLLSFDELMGSLQAHEVRINRSATREEENAFQVQGEHKRSHSNRGRGRGYVRGRGRGRSNPVQCTYCKKIGHSEENCWSKQDHANYVEEEDEVYLFMTYVSSQSISGKIWYLDSACSNHLTREKDKFKELDETYKATVRLGDDKEIQIEGIGTIAVSINGKEKMVQNVFYAPSLAHNLLSVGQLVEYGYSVLFENNTCVVKKKTGAILLQGKMTKNRMFPIDFSCKEIYGMIINKQDETEVWHQRYGHLYVKGLQLLANKEMVKGLPKIQESEHLCKGCALGKQTRRSFPIGKAKRAKEKLELVHADICGPMRTESHAGSKYFLLFIDDYTRMCWIYFLVFKLEAFDCFKKFKAMTERQCNEKLKTLRTDRGGEFISKDFNNFCEEQGIRRELTAPYTPEQNGIAERKNRTIVEMARCMLKTKDLADEFWAEAVATAIYVLNLSPTKAVWNMTPYEAWYESKPSVNHLRIFGCICYALIPSGRHKLDQKTKKYILVGYCTKSKAYRLFDPENKKIVISRDVQFDEHSSWKSSPEKKNSMLDSAYDNIQEEEMQGEISAIPHITSPAKDMSPSSVESTPESHKKFRSIDDIYSSTYAMFVGDPTCVESALKNKDWRRAMQDEILSIKKMELGS